MDIAIIGAGFTGLSAAYRLVKAGHAVTVLEKDQQPGGLAIGYKEKGWEWTLEKHYHHWFANDHAILNLAKEIQHEVLLPRPKTSVFVDNAMYQLDSPLSVLRFPKLPMNDKLRMAAVLGIMRYNPYWKPFEKIYAASFLRQTMGEKAYTMLWEPQFHNKFGKYTDEISLAWFWARIKKRTPSLAYPEGGFLEFANHFVKVIQQYGGNVLFQTETTNIKQIQKGLSVTYIDEHKKTYIKKFDAVLVTLPSFLYVKLAPELPESYKKSLNKLRGLGATNLVLRLKKPFFPNNTYWLSVCDRKSPVMAIVEHTNFMNKKYYNNEHIVYLGNYLPADHPNFSKTPEEHLNLYLPFLKKINPEVQNEIIGYQLFKAPFAQPIIPVNYSTLIPQMITPIKNVFLANIEQVYPWDRGTNYAVELGEKAAKLII